MDRRLRLRAMGTILAIIGMLFAAVAGLAVGYSFVRVIPATSTTTITTISTSATTILSTTTATSVSTVVQYFTTTSISTTIPHGDLQEYSNTDECTEGSNCAIASFSVQYNGYIMIQGKTTDSGAQMQVDDNGTGYGWNGYNQNFGQGPSELTFPVTPGTITTYSYATCSGLFGHCNTYTETLNITYIY